MNDHLRNQSYTYPIVLHIQTYKDNKSYVHTGTYKDIFLCISSFTYEFAHPIGMYIQDKILVILNWVRWDIISI